MNWFYHFSLPADWTWVTVELHDWEETRPAFQKYLPLENFPKEFFLFGLLSEQFLL